MKPESYYMLSNHHGGKMARRYAIYFDSKDAGEKAVETLNAHDDLCRLIADDAYAMTFQSLGQYRKALLIAAQGVKK